MVPEPTGDGFRLDDREVYAVRLVARLEEIIDGDSGAVRLTINDSTGRST